MTSRQIKAAQLRHRMAIQAMTPHRLPKRPTEVERHMADTAVDMLVLIQTLPYIMGDLQEELEKAGQFRHEIKRRHRQAEEIIFFRSRTGLPDICQVQARNCQRLPRPSR